MSDGFPIGELDERAVLEIETRMPDSAGGVTLGWKPVAALWVARQPTSGSEVFDADRTRGRIDTEIIIRYRSGVVPAMRFRIGTRAFEIQSVLENAGRKRFLRCLCVMFTTV